MGSNQNRKTKQANKTCVTLTPEEWAELGEMTNPNHPPAGMIRALMSQYRLAVQMGQPGIPIDYSSPVILPYLPEDS